MPLVGGFGCSKLCLYGIRAGVASQWSSRPMRAQKWRSSTNVSKAWSGPVCLGVVHLQPQVWPGPLQAGDGGPVGRPGGEIVQDHEGGEQGQHQGGTWLCFHWSSSVITVLSLVESFIGMLHQYKGNFNARKCPIRGGFNAQIESIIRGFSCVFMA